MPQIVPLIENNSSCHMFELPVKENKAMEI